MNDKVKIMTAAILIALVLSATPSISASASTKDGAIVHELEYHNGIKNVREKRLSYISNKNIWNYQRFDVHVLGSKLNVSGVTINNIDYIPFRAAANALGISYTYDSKNKTSLMSGRGVVLSATEGCFSVYANDRPLFASSPVVILSDGRMYIPASSFAKATGLTVSKNGKNINLTGSFKAA